MKKTVVSALLSILLAGTMSVTAGARELRSRESQRNAQPAYPVCTATGCEEARIHRHDGEWYCARTDEEEHYAPCAIEGCELAGTHRHDGIHYEGRPGGGQGGYGTCGAGGCAYSEEGGSSYCGGNNTGYRGERCGQGNDGGTQNAGSGYGNGNRRR